MNRVTTFIQDSEQYVGFSTSYRWDTKILQFFVLWISRLNLLYCFLYVYQGIWSRDVINCDTLNYLLAAISFVQKACIFNFDFSVTYPRNGERTFLGHQRHKFMLKDSISEDNMGTALVIEHINWSRLTYG